MKTLHIDERFGVIICLIVALVVGVYFATPGTLWLDVRSMSFSDGKTWREVTVDLDRDIRRDFTGKWRGDVRRREPHGWVSYATTPWTELSYRTDSKLPEPVKLDWLLLSQPRAYELPCGEYDVSVTWVINLGSILWQRDLTRSGTFTIWGPGICTK